MLKAILKILGISEQARSVRRVMKCKTIAHLGEISGVVVHQYRSTTFAKSGIFVHLFDHVKKQIAAIKPRIEAPAFLIHFGTIPAIGRDTAKYYSVYIEADTILLDVELIVCVYENGVIDIVDKHAIRLLGTASEVATRLDNEVQFSMRAQ